MQRREVIDLPTFDFSVLASATGNFSTENKLGEGGFGPVYKVMVKAKIQNKYFPQTLSNYSRRIFSGHTNRWERVSCEKAFSEISARVG